MRAVAFLARLQVGGRGRRVRPEAAQDRASREAQGGPGAAGTAPGGPHCLFRDEFLIARSTCCYFPNTGRFIEVPCTICSTLQRAWGREVALGPGWASLPFQTQPSLACWEREPSLPAPLEINRKNCPPPPWGGCHSQDPKHSHSSQCLCKRQ